MVHRPVTTGKPARHVAPARVHLLCIGTELLMDRVNTDVNYVSRILGQAGIPLRRCVTVGDQEADIVEALRENVGRCEMLLVTGGLGPTFDDRTRDALARVVRKPQVFQEELWEEIRQRFRKRGITAPESNRRQAFVIRDAAVVPNRLGTAPGMLLEHRGTTIVLLPGPPQELVPMLEGILPRLARRYGGPRPLTTRRFGFSGLPESVVEERTEAFREEWERKGIGEFTILAHTGMIELLVRLHSGRRARDLLTMQRQLADMFGDSFLGMDPPSLVEIVFDMLKQRRLLLAVAESCTGGLACSAITELPGASALFEGGVVAYGNRAKKRILKVSRAVLRNHGAVSPEAACSMARSARKAFRTDVGLAFTGIAGPAGATPEKPVGLVWISVAGPGKTIRCERFQFSGTRGLIRERAVSAGWDMVRRILGGVEQAARTGT